MKIVFVYLDGESLGIEYISSFLKSKGHNVSLLFCSNIFSSSILINNRLLSKIFFEDVKKTAKMVISLKPDVVCFSAYTGNYRWCLSIAENIKKLTNVPIVFGGVHTTAVPERVLSNDFIDYAVIGEGEFAMLDLVEHLEKGSGCENLLNTPNICFKYQGSLRINPPRPYVRDLDSLPFPDKAIFYDKVTLFEENYVVITSRGCPYSCTYCINNMYHKIYCKDKQHIRRRSPDNVIEELVSVKKRGKAKLIVFVDDMFTFYKDWLEEFIGKYKRKINLPFFCSTHPSHITKEIAFLLRVGGCWLVTIGIQSGSERLRREVFNRSGSNERIIEAVSYIKDMGIKVSVDNIFGAPSETENDLKQSAFLYNKIKPDRIINFWLTFFPRTDIIDYARKQKILSEKDIQDIEDGYIGHLHDTGSVRTGKIGLYAKYDLMFQLRSLINNDRLYSIISNMLMPIPFKRIASKFILLLNAIKNKDTRFFNLLRYALAKKYI